MKIEIRDEIGGEKMEDVLSSCEGTISESTGKRVFYVTGDRYNIILQFMDEEELDNLIKALEYFKKHKTFPPKE